MRKITRLGAVAAVAVVAAALPVAVGTPDSHAAASCAWMNATRSPATRSAELLKAMTLADKIQMVSGVGFPPALPNTPNVGAAGAIKANPALCIPALVLNDAGAGMGDQQALTTAFPDTIAQTASWDPALATTYGKALGAEAFAKGVNVALAPGVDIARTPLGGRNFEYAGEDPYLAGQAAAAEIKGIQSQHELATVKHFALNDQETNRMTQSSVADERTIQEIHLPAFEAAVKAGVASVMCSYNRVNGVYACENPTLLQKYLKTQLGFRGFVMSDWFATHSTAPSANAGLDMEMPGGYPGGSNRYFGDALTAAVTNGSVPMSRLNDMVHRILLQMFTLGLFDHVPAEGAPAAATNASTAHSIATATQVAQAGSVLLKNGGNVLPVAGTGKKIAVIGSAASPSGATLASQGYGSGHVPEFGYQPGVVSPLSAITARASQNGDTVTYADSTNTTAAAAVAKVADTAIVFVNDVEVEGADRPDLKPHSGTCNLFAGCTYDGVDQDALVSKVAAANPHTVVVLQSGGPVTMPWLSSVAGVVENWYPGQVDGNAITPQLFGDVNFSGKLPVTFPKALSDGPLKTAAQYPGVTAKGDTVGPHSTYSEKLLVGYRWYTAKRITPLFPFGYGLSYTKFKYSGLKITPTSTGAIVKATVANTGRRTGAEVAELYVTDPASAGEPPVQLKGFRKLTLAAGRSGTVTMSLDSRAFSIWNTAKHAWTVPVGCYGISVGGSSASLPLHGSLGRGGGTCTR